MKDQRQVSESIDTIEKAEETDNASTTLRRMCLQVGGKRDWGKAEASLNVPRSEILKSGMILQIPLYHTPFAFPVINLDGTTIC